MVAVTALFLAVNANPQSVPALVNYQGRLTDQTGNPLSAGAYTLQFNLWDSPTLTNPPDLIWNQQHTNITLQANGTFNVILSGLDSAFGTSTRFLGVTVTMSNGVPIPSPSEILPRQQLLTVPYAFNAAAAGTAVTANTANSLAPTAAQSLCPPGSVMAFAGANVPAGWLLCNGAAVSRTTYRDLFSAIGTAWGNGVGSSSFNLPDMRGAFLRGVDGGRGLDPDRTDRKSSSPGGNAGDAVGSFQSDAFASHNHISPFGENHAVAGFNPPWGLYGNDNLFGSNGSDKDNSWPYTSSAGGKETRPKNADVNYIIKY